MSMAWWAIPLGFTAGAGAGLLWRAVVRARKKDSAIGMGPMPTGMTWESMAAELRASSPRDFGSRLSGQAWQAWVDSVLAFPHQVSVGGAQDIVEAACVSNAPVGLLEHWQRQGVDFKARSFALDRLLWESETPSLPVMRFLLERGASADGNPVPGWTSGGPADEAGDPVPYRLLPLARLLGHEEPVLAVLKEHGAVEEPLPIGAGKDNEVLLWEWLLENEWSLASVERLLAAGVSPTKGLAFAIEMSHVLAIQVLLAHGADPFEVVGDETGIEAVADWEEEQAMRLVFEYIPANRRVEAVMQMERVGDVDLSFLEQTKQWVTALAAGRPAMEEAVLWLNPASDEGFAHLCSMASGYWALEHVDVLLRSLVDASPSRLQDILSTSALPWVPGQFKTAVAHRKAGSLDIR